MPEPLTETPAQPAENASRFEPRIVAFLCNWCSYAGADKAGAAQIRQRARHPRGVQRPGRPGIRSAGVPQGRRRSPDSGHAGDCHYKEGNFRTIQCYRLLQRTLQQFGIEVERCRLDFVAASEREKYARVITEMVDSVRALGPLTLEPR